MPEQQQALQHRICDNEEDFAQILAETYELHSRDELLENARIPEPDDEDDDGDSHVEPHEDDADVSVEDMDADDEEAPVECEGAVPVEAEKDAAKDKPADGKGQTSRCETQHVCQAPCLAFGVWRSPSHRSGADFARMDAETKAFGVSNISWTASSNARSTGYTRKIVFGRNNI